MPSPAPPRGALSAALRLLPSLTTALSLAFAAWMAHSFAVLYRVAVPPVPAVAAADAARAGLVPLWGNASRLSLFLALSEGSNVAPLFTRDTERSVALLALTGRGPAFAYGFGFGAGLDLELDLELLRAGDSGNAGGGATADAAGAAMAAPTGLRLTCARTASSAAG